MMEPVFVWIWLGAVAFFVFLESVTWMLVSVWCAVGALAAVFAAHAGVSLTNQLLIFVGVSLVAFAAVRPLAKRCVIAKAVPTNADRLLGACVRVTEAIDNTAATGAVYADGKTWTARSVDGKAIPEGELVEVECLEGVKLMVRARTAVTTP